MPYPEYRLPFEGLTTIDERVDYVHNQLIDVHNQLVDVQLAIDQLREIAGVPAYISDQLAAVQLALNQLLEREGIPTMAQVTKGVSIEVTAQPLQGVKNSKYSPLTGRITQVIPHWPSGCEDPATGIPLVDIAFGHADTWVYPGEVDTFLALNDVTPVINISEPITRGEELWINVRNGDSVNPHTVSITLTIIGVAEE